MLGLKVTIRYAQQVKQYLVEHNLFDKQYAIVREAQEIVFPVTREFTPPFDFDVEFTQMEGNERQQTQSLREALSKILTPEEQQDLVTAYDIVGSIAIIEISDSIILKQSLIGQKILEINKTVKTVLKKIGGHGGIYRVQRMGHIAGEDTRETIVTENGVKLKVNVETAYYSIRMATERKRILEQIKPGEKILCLFSGIGPYPVVFSVHSGASQIVGIEINPAAHELAIENLGKNRCTNVRLFCGDANDILEKLASSEELFDRVTMPLPHTAKDFLDATLRVCKSGTIIHYYAFLPEGAFNGAIPQLRAAFESHNFTFGKYDVIRVGQHAPRVWRICVDAEVKKSNT